MFAPEVLDGNVLSNLAEMSLLNFLFLCGLIAGFHIFPVLLALTWVVQRAVFTFQGLVPNLASEGRGMKCH